MKLGPSGAQCGPVGPRGAQTESWAEIKNEIGPQWGPVGPKKKVGLRSKMKLGPSGAQWGPKRKLG